MNDISFSIRVSHVVFQNLFFGHMRDCSIVFALSAISYKTQKSEPSNRAL